MKNRFFLLLLLMPAVVMADIRYRELDETSIIEDSICVPALNGEGYVHLDEDVSGLEILVTGTDGALVALYDAGTEIEDIAVIGTYAAPSAINVRVSPQNTNGPDCTQMMFDDAIYANQNWVHISISDNQTTIMDFERWVFLNTLTGRMTGLRNFTSINSIVSPTEFVIVDGATNDDAYPAGSTILVKGANEECEAEVADYTGLTKTLFLTAACPLTIEVGDLVWLRSSSSGPGTATIDSLVDALNTTVNAINNNIGEPIDVDLTTDIANLDAAIRVQTGTCSSGSPTTCVDAALTEADDDYWRDNAILFTTGTVAGQSRCVSAFAQASDTLTFDPPVTQAIGTNDYILTHNPACSLWNQIIEDTGATYTARCLMAAVMSYTAGEWSQSGPIVTYQDTGGNETRIVGTIASPGFNTVTVTCP